MLLVEGQNRRITRNACQRLLNKFGMEDFMAQKGLCNPAKTKSCKTKVSCPVKKEMPSESARQCMKKTS